MLLDPVSLNVKSITSCSKFIGSVKEDELSTSDLSVLNSCFVI